MYVLFCIFCFHGVVLCIVCVQMCTALLPPSVKPIKCKGKAVPLQARSGPEGSRKLSFPDFMTTTQVGGKVVSLKHRPSLPPGHAPGTHFC